jgi:hypothetical protein
MPTTITIPELVTQREVAAMVGVPNASAQARSDLMSRLGVKGTRLIGLELRYSREAVVAAIAARLTPKEPPRVSQPLNSSSRRSVVAIVRPNAGRGARSRP